MCLGVPGRIERIDAGPGGMSMGIVSFGGIRKEVCLAYVPEAGIGDFVVVHVGFAISKVDESEADRMMATLHEMGELEELGSPRPAGESGAPA
jgi:hydrogenase expression/formation protein HypC